MHDATCAICSNLGRERRWGHDFQVPTEIEVLVPQIAIGVITSSTIRCCPQCGTYYVYFYDTGIEDWSPYTQVELDRLTPPATLQRLTGEALREYRARYDAVLQRLRAELENPNAAVRSLAAFDLTACALERPDAVPNFDEVCALLRHGDVAVCASSLAYLIGPAKAGLDLSALVDDLEQLLDARDKNIVERAADALTWHQVHRRNHQAIERLLADARPNILFAITHKLWIAGDQGPDVRPFVPRLRELLEHPNVNIAGDARSLLERIPGESPPLSLFLRHLRDGNCEQRNEALRVIEQFAMRKGAEFASALPALAAAARDRETEYLAIEALKTAAEFGRDIAAIVPALLQILGRDTRSPRHTDIALTLDRFFEKAGIRKFRAFLPGLAPHLNHANMQVRATATHVFVAASHAGFDVSFAVDELQRAVGTADSFGCDAARVLAAMALRKKKPPA